MRPIAYTIAPFITARCLEQIRLDICYQRVPVVLVATGAGLSYASLNATHHSCEDIAWLRALPNMTVLCPGDPIEVRLALRAALQHDGPVYLRIGKKGEPNVHVAEPAFKIGQSITLRPGSDVRLLSTGNVLPLAVAVSEALVKRGVSCGVVSCPTVKPLDREALRDAFTASRLVVTLEEHSVIGGFGGAVAEWLSDQPRHPAKLLRQGTADAFLYEAGEQEHARHKYGLTVESVTQAIMSELANL
jgi:transketolase